ncbi:MAG: hypothetical protein LBG95_02675 [Treponema sp.]|jgi:hypothetical protein|nr:hypothetical protein [Treponema sp.]
MKIVKKITLFLFFVMFIFACSERQTDLQLGENNQIIFFRERNNDTSMREKLFLSFENVKATQKFIMKNYPTFDFEYWYHEFALEKHKTDDISIQNFVNDFNQDGPAHCAIYLSGVENDTGYSSVGVVLNGHLYIDDPKFYSFHYFFDEQYSDYSGISFIDYEVGVTRDSDILWLERSKYGDTGNYFWRVAWPWNDTDDDDDIFRISKIDERTAILTFFLRQLRTKKVFEEIDLEWFGIIYTRIDNYQQRINDLLWEFNEK